MKIYLVIDQGTYYNDRCFGLEKDKRNDLAIYGAFKEKATAEAKANELNRGFQYPPFKTFEKEVV